MLGGSYTRTFWKGEDNLTISPPDVVFCKHVYCRKVKNVMWFYHTKFVSMFAPARDGGRAFSSYFNEAPTQADIQDTVVTC